MSHSGVPVVSQVASFLGGGDAPPVQAPPAPPTPGAQTQEAEEAQRKEEAGGAAANMLTNPAAAGTMDQNLVARNILLGA